MEPAKGRRYRVDVSGTGWARNNSQRLAMPGDRAKALHKRPKRVQYRM
jgi:hypothetical protein